MIYTKVIGVLLIAASVATALTTAYLYGQAAGRNACEAAAAREQAVIDKAIEVATETSAAAIREIKIQHRTINQRVEREIQTNTVFRDCRLPDGMRDTINEAITGRRPDTAASGVLPSPDPTGR